jgi:hypothetical protein
MYFFLFEDDTPFIGTNITGNTFYMTAKYYNAKDGTVIDFVNQTLSQSTPIVEESHIYYKVIINRTDYSYQVFDFYGSQGARIGETGSPIRFYERRK